MEIEKLLKPVSAESPCGSDLEYDPDFLKLSKDLESPQESIVENVPEKNLIGMKLFLLLKLYFYAPRICV
ncbi:MAG: type VI secretion system ImpA family N-terminal domain-containing protein [Nitrosomonas sp.]|nr:type VI secretion system ImpA family N-terminal domain-containing protein [Nitrosomonas sp.]